MKLKRNDILLILGLLLAAGLMWFFFRPGEAGAAAVIMQNGKEIRRIDLTTDQELTIAAENGYNTLLVENGTISVSDADCGDHTCIHTGRISREGEQIVCLPHKLVIEIAGGEASELDASTH